MKLKNKFIIILTLFVLMFSGTFALTTELVKTNPSPVVAGEYADITLRFTNNAVGTDNDLSDVSFEVEKTNLILPVSSSSNYINKILSGEEITRTFRVFFSSDLEQGNIDVPVLIKYNGISSKVDVPIFIQNSQNKPEIYIGQITSTPNEILQDSKNNKLSITLQNLGDKSADLVKVKLIAKDQISPSYAYSFEDSISSIKGGEQAVAKFTLDVNKSVQKPIPATLVLRYRAKDSVGNTYKTYNKKINFTIPITPAPYLVVEKVEPLTKMKIGTTEQKIKVTIKNEGTQDADEVRVRVVPDISYPFIFEETTAYVGAKIKVGQTADVVFKLEVTKDGQVKNYSSIAVIETLVENTRYSREDIISITPTPGQKTDISTFAYLIVAAILLVSVVIGFNTYKTNNKKEKKK